MLLSKSRFRFLASLVAVFGENDISGDLEPRKPISKNVRRVIVHRQYDAATFENDLAVLELDSPVTFNSHIGKCVLVMIELLTYSELLRRDFIQLGYLLPNTAKDSFFYPFFIRKGGRKIRKMELS